MNVTIPDELVLDDIPVVVVQVLSVNNSNVTPDISDSSILSVFLTLRQ